MMLAKNQLTSSQQSLPGLPQSQGLYASFLMIVIARVHSLSARSFKIRHVMRCGGKSGNRVYLWQNLCVSWSRTINCIIIDNKFKGQTRLKLIRTESTWHLQFEEFLLCRLIITPFVLRMLVHRKSVTHLSNWENFQKCAQTKVANVPRWEVI